MILFFLFPDTDRQNTDSYDNHRTHRTQWTEYSYYELLVDDIRVKKYTTSWHRGEDFRWASGLREPTPESNDKKYRVHNSSYHREGYPEVTEREYNSTRILEYTRTWEWLRDVAWHRLESCTICAIPVFVGRDREIDSIEYTDSRENSDDEIFAHKRRG